MCMLYQMTQKTKIEQMKMTSWVQWLFDGNCVNSLIKVTALVCNAS